MTINSPLRILITRLSHIGDCIQTVPMLCALRTHIPNAHITWIMERGARTLIEGHDALDELMVIDRGWLKSPVGIWRMRRRLRDMRFDVAIDPQGLTKSSVLGWLSGAPKRIGFAPEDGRELSPVLNNVLVSRKKDNVVDRYLELLQALDCDSPVPDYRLPGDISAETAITEFIKTTELNTGFVVINPGAGWASRLWSNQRFAQVAAYLSQRYSLSSVVAWAGDDERRMAEQIAAESNGAATVAPPTSLQELASLMRLARMYVGTDTGPLHLAVAMGTKCISMHGTTPAEKSGPFGEGHITLQRQRQIGSSRKWRDNEAMLAITVDDVCDACDTILAAQSKNAA